MTKNTKTPDFIFESSWEVCNKIGGIYTVLSTRAKTMQDMMHDRVVFIGPDHWEGKENPLFIEDANVLKTWVAKARREGLKVRTGRWNIPGEPIVVLVDFKEYFEKRDELYGELWEIAGIETLTPFKTYPDGFPAEFIHQFEEDLPLRMEIDTQGENFLAYGENLLVTCRVMRGWEDMTAEVREWEVTRDSGDAADDAAWKLRNKVKDFCGGNQNVDLESGQIILCHCKLHCRPV